MLNLRFYANFEKKFNSTKTPTGNATLTVSGYFREPSSIMRPVINLERFAGDSNPYIYTYVFIPNTGRYYFVNDWVWNDGLWQVHLECDVLGTYKQQIGSSTEYVLRADTTTEFNGAITDMMYPATTNFNIEKVVMQNPFVNSLSQGTYVVGIINKSSTDAVGAITYYAMTPGEFGSLKDKLFSNDNLEIMGILDSLGNLAINDCSAELFRTLYNPYQYISSCMWFPITKSEMAGTQVSSIPLGWWEYPLNGKRLSEQTGQFIDGVEQVPVHPQAPSRGKYLNYSPYTKITLFGKFGILPLDPSFLEIGSYLRNYYTVDYITGECVFTVYVSPTSGASPDQVHIAKTSFMIGVPIQIAQIGMDYFGTAVSAIDTVKNVLPSMTMGAISGGPSGAITAGLISGANGVYNTLQTAMPQLQSGGSNGSFCVTDQVTVMVVLQYVIADENLAHKGRPVCSNKVLNTLSGFIQCAEPDIDISCFNEERLRIGRFLVEGFYME